MARKHLVLAVTAAFAASAVACAESPPEPQHTAHGDVPKLDYAQPRSIEKPADFDVRVRHVVARASRGGSPPRSSGGDVWAALARCESSMRQDAVGEGKYLSYFQWAVPTWRSVGGEGDPRDASYDVQVQLAKRLQARNGWGQWPRCSRKLGLA